MKNSHCVLVFGGRDYPDEKCVRAVLSILYVQYGDRLCVIHGDCKTGADKFADKWCEDHGITPLKFPADWNKYGRAAGPIRNSEMAKQPIDSAIRFGGGKGSADMTSKLVGKLKLISHYDKNGDGWLVRLDEQ